MMLKVRNAQSNWESLVQKLPKDDILKLYEEVHE